MGLTATMESCGLNSEPAKEKRMKKLIVSLALAALTVPVFAAQAEGQAPAQEQQQEQQTTGKKKAAKKSAKKKHKKSRQTTSSEQK